MIEKLPDHISFSQAMMWMKCQRQHLFRYGLGLKMPPPGSMVVGSAVHKGLQHTALVKAVAEKEPPWDEVADVYAETFHELAQEAIWEDEQPGQAKDRGYKALKLYYDEHAKVIQPAGVDAIERKLEVPLPQVGVPLVMIVDLITADKVVVDYKTTKQRVNSLPDEVRTQLWLYQHGLELSGIDTTGAEAHFLVAGERSQEVAKLRAEKPVVSEILWVLNGLAAIRAQIEQAYASGVFAPSVPGAWWCSPKWCGYWDLCHREF